MPVLAGSDDIQDGEMSGRLCGRCGDDVIYDNAWPAQVSVIFTEHFPYRISCVGPLPNLPPRMRSTGSKIDLDLNIENPGDVVLPGRSYISSHAKSSEEPVYL
jgi:hypothetical protein